MQQLSFNTFKKKWTFIAGIFALSVQLIIFLQSCNKIVGDKNPPFSRSSFLISEKWGLSSATSISSLSTGTLIGYKGATVDSLNFVWMYDPNVDIYGINSFIGGTNTQYNFKRIGYNTNVNQEDTSTIAYDTLMLTTSWKQGYSDTLFVTKTSPTQLVFNVRYALPNGNGVEVDSFRSIGHY